MKKLHAPTPKLISRRLFVRKLAALQEKHHWFLKDKTVDIRPGWMSILDTTLLKIRLVLSAEDVDQSHLEFLYSATGNGLRIFVDGEQLSPARFKAISHILDEATQASDCICFKCGGNATRSGYQRFSGTCEEHRDYEGDFIEDYRRFQKLKKSEAEEQRKQEESSASKDQDDDGTLDVIDATHVHDAADDPRPTLQIYSIEDVQRVKDSLRTRSSDSDSRTRLKNICDEMIKRGGERPYCTLPELSAFNALTERFPNMREVIEVISSAVALAKIGDGKIEIPPLLMLGPPGVGKTQIATEIASLIDTAFLTIHMESEQSGSTITGSSEFWSNSQNGLVFNTLTTGETANPLILLDELDKVGGDSRYDPAAGLYSLLERETAKKFVDQSIRGLPIDASGVIWFLTANDESLIPAPIRSRVLVKTVRPPTFDESIKIAQSIYDSIRNSRPWGIHFSPELSRSVAEKLATLEPRRMKTFLLNAFGIAAIKGKFSINPDDLPMVPRTTRHIGFLPCPTSREDGSGTDGHKTGGRDA